MDAGGACERADVLVVELGAGSKSPRWAWEKGIMEAQGNTFLVYSNSSNVDTGESGGGCWVREAMASLRFLGTGAGVWDVEVSGMEQALSLVKRGNVLILLFSGAAIQAIERAGRCGQACTGSLDRVVETIPSQ